MVVKSVANSLLLTFLTLAAVAQVAPPQAPPKPAVKDDRILNLNGRAVHIRTDGPAGAPVVIFEAGMGDTLETWSRVIPEVSKMAQTLAYDRAGSGQSSSVNGERSYAQIASELHELVQSLKLPPPYILVGHAFGAVLVRAYCAAYPSEVSGIVFDDPMSENMLVALAKINGEPDERLASASKGVHSEYEYLNKDLASDFRVLKALPTPNVPMSLLVARSVRPPGWERAVLDRYQPWILGREDSSMTVTANSTTFIHRDEPELLVNTVRRLLFPNQLPALRRARDDKGITSMLALYREQTLRYPKQDLSPDILNTLGYEELREKHIDDAIRIFALNAETYPTDSNAYDSLGDAYVAKGDRQTAIANYRKSLKLDPKNLHAAGEIAKLTNK